MTITAALMLVSLGSAGAATAKLHQHQGIGGPTTHHHHGPRNY